MLPSARDTTSAPRYSLSRLITTACTLAVYASQRRVTSTLRKTRFRWVASPCRVGFGPTGFTSKGFRIHLLHPSPLSRLSLARVTSLPPSPQDLPPYPSIIGALHSGAIRSAVND